MHRHRILAALLVLASIPACAQMPMKPGAEVKKLDFFAGTWTTEGTIAQGPWGNGGKFTSTGTGEWMDGNFFLVAHADYTMPPELGGSGKEVAVLGYDTNQNVYTHDSFNSMGNKSSSTGSLSGDTWTFNSSATYDGQDFKQRMTIKTLSPTSYTMKFEISTDGANWMTFMEGKATKK